MTHRFAERVKALRDAVLTSAGALDRPMREAAAAGRLGDLRAPASSYVDKVRQHAWKVTDEDIAELRRAGYNDEEIFELTVSTALGAALLRLEAGMRALEAAGPAKGTSDHASDQRH